MDYSKCSVEELVLDDYFRQWATGQLPKEDRFWESWLNENPESVSKIDRARFVLRSLEMQHVDLQDHYVQDRVSRIMTEVNKDAQTITKNPFSIWWRIAAVLALALGLAWYWSLHTGSNPSLYETMSVDAGSKHLEKINNADTPLTISLSDGSTIVLEPGSKLSYPATFATNKREVLLSGEAFFDVARDPSRPFSVYANDLVTKVLGTSFSVKAYDTDDQVTVKVVTGKVSVLKAKPHGKSNLRGSSEGLILTPNQMAVYGRNNEKLVRSLVENPVLVKSSNKKPADFNFQDIPVANVFEVLEEGYGIPIVYNADLLAECTVTAPLGNETLYEKLDMICKVIRASYEVVDGQVVITSTGCK